MEIDRCSISAHKFHSFSGKCTHNYNFRKQSLVHFWLVENTFHLHHFRNWRKYFQLPYQSFRYDHQGGSINLFVWNYWHNHRLLDFELERVGRGGKITEMPTCFYWNHDNNVYFCVNALQ